MVILFMIFAYLLGSLSSAIIYCKVAGLPDPRTKGSKNPGATNVMRIGGKKAAAIVLAGDVLKGILPVFFAKLIGFSPSALGWIAVAAFIGHIYPAFFYFRGGKGVATAFGTILALSLTTGFLVTVVWCVTAAVFRYVSAASIVAAISAPLFIYFFSDKAYLLPVMLMSILIVIRHQKNIKDLIRHKEPKI